MYISPTIYVQCSCSPGEMYDEILSAVKSVVDGSETELKLQYYSGHDSTIVALQELLGVSSVGLVRAGSGLALELHLNQTTSQYYLQVCQLCTHIV